MSTLDETVDSIGNEPFDLIPETMNQHFGHRFFLGVIKIDIKKSRGLKNHGADPSSLLPVKLLRGNALEKNTVGKGPTGTIGAHKQMIVNQIAVFSKKSQH